MGRGQRRLQEGGSGMGFWDRCQGESLIVHRCSSSTNDSLPYISSSTLGRGVLPWDPGDDVTSGDCVCLTVTRKDNKNIQATHPIPCVLRETHGNKETLLHWRPNGLVMTQEGNPTQPAVALGQMMEGVAAMQREQAAFNRQFLGMLQNQMEHLLSTPAAAPSSKARSPLAGLTLHKMSEADDPQSFLEMFEATAEACGWPAEEWAVRLLTLLSGEAQTAALGLGRGYTVAAARGLRSGGHDAGKGGPGTIYRGATGPDLGVGAVSPTSDAGRRRHPGRGPPGSSSGRPGRRQPLPHPKPVNPSPSPQGPSTTP